MLKDTALNSILIHVLAGSYSEGLSAYEQLPTPSQEDRRWAALCMMHCNQWMRAKLVLLEAVAQGYAEANIELATLYRSIGETDLARLSLDGLDLSGAAEADQALHLRELGLQAHQRGELSDASALLEKAWFKAVASGLGPPLITPIAHVLGMVCAERGLDSRAETHFDYALEHANSVRQVFVLASRAVASTYLGHLSRAHEDLSAARRCPVEATSAAILQVLYAEGVTARAGRSYGAARTAFLELSAQAAGVGDIESASYAELWLVSAALAEGQVGQAAQHLARAEHLSATAKTQAMVLLRRGLLQIRQGGDAISTLLAASALFGTLGSRREEGWCWLHLCEAYLAAEQEERAAQALGQALQLRYALNTPSLAIELDNLPRVRAYVARASSVDAQGLLSDERRFTTPPKTHVTMQTLGAGRLLLNGEPLGLNMSRTAELLTYFFTHRAVTMPQLQLALFSDHTHKRSKSYIHQVRAEVQSRVPGLSIPFDAVTKTYSLTVEDGVTLEWDVEALLTALKSDDAPTVLQGALLYQAPFLAESSTDWAEFTRTELHHMVLSRCKQHLAGWTAAQQWAWVLALTEALSQVEHFDEEVCEFLVTALAHVRGEDVARARLTALTKRWAMEYGDVPERLRRLAGHLGAPTGP